MSLFEAYANSLAELIGNDFQAEVCARFQSLFLDFQTIPAKPQGDAGLDAFPTAESADTAAMGLTRMASLRPSNS
jgi:hypothetical protein